MRVLTHAAFFSRGALVGWIIQPVRLAGFPSRLVLNQVLQRDTIKCLPKLEEVEIMGSFLSSTVDFRSLEPLSVLVLRRFCATVFPLLPGSILVLDFSENPAIRWSFQDLAAPPLPNPESFKADYNPWIRNAHVLAILAPSLGKRSLQSLSLHRCPGVGFDSLEWLITHVENLEELAIGGLTKLTDEILKEAATFKKLRYLGLSHSGISGMD